MINPQDLDFGEAVTYHYGMFPPASLDYERLIPSLTGAVDAVARFDQMLATLKNTDILLAPLRNQEAVISSRMEGTVSTMDEILRYEADVTDESDAEADRLNVRSEVIETILYQRALRRAERAMEAGQPLTEHLIRSLHQVLLSFGRGATKSPGQYKDEQNYIVGHRRNVLFVPIDPPRLPEGMERLMAFIRDSDIQVLLKAAISHLEFEALHPFKDGNGRIGRMIITLMLWNAKVISSPHFYISAYLEERRDDYLSLMRSVSQTGQWTEWCDFFLQAVSAQAERNLSVANDISTLYEDMKPVFSQVLSSRYSIQTLDFVFENPVFRNSTFQRQSGIPHASARRLTPLLAQAGLLDTIEESSGPRATLYRFEPMMKLVRV